MRNIKKAAVLALASAAAVTGSIVAGSPAMAASSPVAACGGGSYHVIDQHDLGKATVYLLYNGSTNCVVTWKDSPNSTFVNAVVQRKDQNYFHEDPGNFSTYAGPVKVSAAGTCVGWGGVYGSTSWMSNWSHCG